ncbi:cellulose synthase A catalytic subunit 3 [UDP-forming]-like [Impatiens glandulifera]|uniref:cellulose synthase A catalytic subunit 3 [UDP-forming]-like n=1 Tax=Impatiens glandulifera TaxID=253017 RepID=UPI001FB08585|nr:cellulose synthase A catalytic subunit 3 [UDP-forming]-like [Impatiens glandulifera]
MESEGETGSKKQLKNLGGQICQICSDNVGTAVDGEPFIACDVCAFPVCRPCYEYERKDGNQSCPQCKTHYKRHKGSPTIHGDGEEEVDLNAATRDFNHTENQYEKQKVAERMLSWHTSYGRGEDVAPPNYDKEVSHNHIPLLTSGHEVSGELSAASPEQMSMASPGPAGGNSNIRVVDPVREFGASGLGNVAWKERVEGWKMKQDKSTVVQTTTSHAASERGVGDIDATTDVLVDDSLLNDEARQPLSRKVSVPSSRINPYRMVIVLRLVILIIFLHYRITNPVRNAYALWLVSVICEIWFAISWILDQFPKWLPINRETYLDPTQHNRVHKSHCPS